MTSIGTRNPSPIGRANPPASLGSDAVTSSPAVRCGATGGATWSKKPPFSSYVANTTVLAQTAGLAVRVLTTLLMNASPTCGDAGGCSSWPGWEHTHDTLGRLPDCTSVAKSSTLHVKAFLNSAVEGSAYCLK